jgi:hypothetical protein
MRIDAMRPDGTADRLVLRQYGELMLSLYQTALPTWDLYAALRHAGRMTGWRLSPVDLARLATGHREFTSAALAQLPSAGKTVQNDQVANANRRSAVACQEDESAP